MHEVVVTRVEQHGQPRDSRNLEERLVVRFPRGYQALSALSLELLSPRSRLRRAFLRRQLVSAYAAFRRRDYELILVRYARDVRFQFESGLAGLGMSGTHHGHEGMRKGFAVFEEAWGPGDIAGRGD